LIAAVTTAFISIFVAEFGDKTQLISLSMAGRYPPLQVLGGALTGLALVMGLAVGAGGLVAAYIPPVVITAASGVFFILMGLFTLFCREPERELRSGYSGFYQTVMLIFFAELGDKSQMTALLLSAHFARPAAVFIGAMAGDVFKSCPRCFFGRTLHFEGPFPPLKKGHCLPLYRYRPGDAAPSDPGAGIKRPRWGYNF